MKRIILLILCLSLLCGCSLPLSSEYISVTEHNDPFAYKEEDTPTEQTPQIRTASGIFGLRAAITSMINDGIEDGKVRLIDYTADLEHFSGDWNRTLKDLSDFAKSQPIIAYATDYIGFTTDTEDGYQVVHMHAVYNRTLSEIKAIKTVRGTDAAIAEFKNALAQAQSSLTLQISGYSGEDLAQILYQYCTENPQLFPEYPIIRKINYYPDKGNVRVVEALFEYTLSADALRTERSYVESLLDALYYSVSSSASALERISSIVSYLNSRSLEFSEASDASVFDLLENGIGNSRCFASVISYLCSKAGMECRTVHGRRNDSDYDWCIVLIDEEYRHVDLLSNILNAEPVRFFTDDEMEGYEWQQDAYPACTSAEEEQD